ncbi:MAG: SAM-dependent methyltransferase [Candidatus Omnitrophica bacterium]|nr:SAM-dependent methyltransferase [Candidatus Omnitrophota bacterium]
MSKLYLIPSSLVDDDVSALPQYVIEAVRNLRCFMVEDEKTVRRFLRKLLPDFPLQECEWFNLNEHTDRIETQKFFEASCHKDIGIISEAGCPCVADPGADVVLSAHKKGIDVVPLVGPSSILLALMASGLGGQNFAFVGYLPKDKAERARMMKMLEKRSAAEKQTQIFMETPYRNLSLFQEIVATFAPSTMLCVAANLTSPDQYIKTQNIHAWKKFQPPIDKKPALFLIFAF